MLPYSSSIDMFKQALQPFFSTLLGASLAPSDWYDYDRSMHPRIIQRFEFCSRAEAGACIMAATTCIDVMAGP